MGMAHPQLLKIAWIGAGVMGGPMAAHLIKAGHHVTIHTRTPNKAQGLIDQGARWAASPAEAAQNSDIAISMVGFPEDVEQVHLGARGTLAASRRPGLIIDMTTSRPSLAVRICEAAKQLNVGSLDAPVSGGDVGAR